MLTVKNKVNTYLNNRLKRDDDAPYKDKELYFTAEKQYSPKELPTLSVVSLGEPQSGNDLERKTQNYITSTIELKAYCESLADCYSLIDKAGNCMIEKMYSLTFGPENISDNYNKIVVARFSRLIGSGDTF